MKTFRSVLEDLTWGDLSGWAGSTILNRGKSYIKNVDELFCTKDGGLAAWVSGSEDYATSVHLNTNGTFDAHCSCPYDYEPCKHAVAVVLAGLEEVKHGRKIPLLDDEDDLSLVLYGDPEDDEEYDLDTEPIEVTTVINTRTGDPLVRKILEAKTQKELLVLLIDLASQYPEIKRQLIESEQLQKGNIKKLVRSLHQEIKQVTREPAWRNHWKGESDLPDYSHILEQLQALLAKGHADVVLELGEALWEMGNAQVEQSNDEGDTAMAIAECMAVVLQAVPLSSFPPAEQLLWVIDRALEDEYSLLDSSDSIITMRRYDKIPWQEVATTLEERLQRTNSPSRYQRERLLRQLLDAYGRSGWQEKIIPLLEKEADACQCYARLVDALLLANEKDKARLWCIQGFNRTEKTYAGIASTLQNKLQEMAMADKNYPLVAAYHAQNFFDHPCRENYTQLRAATEEIQAWPAVRGGLLRYLETGSRPDLAALNKEVEDWPLPQPEVMRKLQREQRHYPDLGMLIDIAILEQRFDDVVELYHALNKTKRWGREIDKRVAKAVAQTHPHLALEIWRKIVDDLISLVKPKAYEEAAGYLRLMREVFTKNDRLTDWTSLLGWLRVEHKPKRRLLEVLDGLEKKKIIG